MPNWLAIICWIAGGLVAFGTIWGKVISPGAKLIVDMRTMLPQLGELNKAMELTRALRDTPSAYQILQEIVKQFRTDSGSSLRDAVDGLVRAAEDNRLSGEANKVAAEVLAVHVQAVKLLAEEDRDEARKLASAVKRLTTEVAALRPRTATRRKS